MTLQELYDQIGRTLQERPSSALASVRVVDQGRYDGGASTRSVLDVGMGGREFFLQAGSGGDKLPDWWVMP